MFYSCEKLTSINLQNFNTKEVENMIFTFYSCKSIKSLDLSSFDMTYVLSMSFMFSGDILLESIIFPNSLKTENVKSMNNMFSYCGKLTSLDLTNFGGKRLTTISSMFRSCSSLKPLKLDNFKPIN